MGEPDSEALLGVLALEAFSGLSSNFFIIFSLSGCKRNNIVTNNLILISLCISLVFNTIAIYAYFAVTYVWPQVFGLTYVFHIFYYTTLYTITSCMWLTASLCVFYFIKIVDVRSRTVAWVKKKIGTIVPGMILTAEIVSLCGSFLSLLISTQQPAQQNSSLIAVNVTSESPGLSFTSVVLILNSLPVLVAITATASSAWYLRRYNRQMKRNMGTLANTHVRDCHRAVHTMMHLVVFYTFYFLVLLLSGLVANGNNIYGYWVYPMLLFSFATVQSAILIHGNPMLKDTLRRVIAKIAKSYK